MKTRIEYESGDRVMIRPEFIEHEAEQGTVYVVTTDPEGKGRVDIEPEDWPAGAIRPKQVMEESMLLPVVEDDPIELATEDLLLVVEAVGAMANHLREAEDFAPGHPVRLESIDDAKSCARDGIERLERISEVLGMLEEREGGEG